MRRMKKPSQLGEEELADIAGHVQDWLYYDERLPIETPDRYRRDRWREYGASEIEEFMAAMHDLLSSLGMDPPGSPEDVEKAKKIGELAEFVDGLMKDGGANDLEPRPLVTAPHPLAAEELKRGDIVILIDGKVRLHDRAEAVKRLLTEFYLWSGGFKPAETSHEERNTFLAGRDLDEAQESAMWPERQAVQS